MDESVSSGVGFWDRVDVWADSAKIVRDYPAFGAGSDSWPVTFLHYQRPPWTPFFNSVAQNDYVEAAAEMRANRAGPARMAMLEDWPQPLPRLVRDTVAALAAVRRPDPGDRRSWASTRRSTSRCRFPPTRCCS